MMRPKQIRWLIGIDPDLKKNGFSVYDRQARKMVQVETLTFYRLIRMMQKNYPETDACEVYIEGGWLHKGLYKRHEVVLPDRLKDHPVAAAKYIAGVRERKSKNVGENHAAGKLLAEFLTEEGYTVIIVKPTAQKWTPHQMHLFTGIETTDSEKIDSTHLVYGR